MVNKEPSTPPIDMAEELAKTRQELDECRESLRAAHEEHGRLIEVLRELGTPVLPIHDGILVMPLIGHLDSSRGEHLMDDLMLAITRHQAQVVLIDITGVSIVDTSVANMLIQTTRAAALLGAKCLLVGVSAAVSRTLVQLGVNLAQVSTKRDLQAGLVYALKHRGYAIVLQRPEIDWLTEFDKNSETASESEAAASTPDAAPSAAIDLG